MVIAYKLFAYFIIIAIVTNFDVINCQNNDRKDEHLRYIMLLTDFERGSSFFSILGFSY